MNLTTTYMGLALEHPLVASAGPLSQSVDGIRELEDAGAAAVVMFSLFEEQIRAETIEAEFLEDLGHDPDRTPGAPGAGEYRVGIDRYLEIVRAASESVDIPIIGSINGTSSEWWIEYAEHIEQAGASGIELNVFYIPTDLDREGWEIEREYVDILAAVKGAVSVPVAIKLNPYFTALGHMARRLDEAGADALVLFNRFYQPDLDLERLTVERTLELSDASEIRLPLLWIAILHGHVGASLAATSGVESGTEVVKYLLAGADVVMTTSALLRQGPGHLGTLRRELEAWLEAHGHDSVTSIRGRLSRSSAEDPSCYVRANYIRILEEGKSIAGS